MALILDSDEEQTESEPWQHVKSETTKLPVKPVAPAPVQAPPRMRYRPEQVEAPYFERPRRDVRITLRHRTVQEAFDYLYERMIEYYHEDQRYVTVVTGKGIEGQGIIRRELPGWLETDYFKPYVASWVQAQPSDGGDGAFRITLKRPK